METDGRTISRWWFHQRLAAPWPVWGPCVALLLLAAACASPPPPDRPVAPPAPPAPETEAVYPIVVGVEYVRLESPARTAALAELLAPLGATGAKPWCEHVEWGTMQPSAASPIDFERLDAFVESFQAAGFRELLICLDSSSAWASGAPNGRLRPRSPAPRPEYFDAYGRWVAAIVERYDADGVADMAGLRRAVRLYEVGGEFESTPGEPTAKYLAMLERAHRAAHAAFPGVMVAHAAFLTTGMLERERTNASGFAASSDRIARHDLSDLRQVLDRPDLFDALNVHALGDPGEIDAIADWLEAETAARGYTRPLLVSDTATTPFVAWGAATTCDAPRHEMGLLVGAAVEEDRCRLADYFGDLVAGRPETLAWARGFAAADLVKKVVVAADHDAWLVNTSLVEDLEWWKDPVLAAGAGNTAWSGFLDVRRREARPSFFALRQLMTALRGRDSVTRLETPRDDVRLYALDGPAGPAWIAWFEPRQLVLPGEPVPAAIVSFPTGAPRMRIEETITHEGQREPAPLVVDTADGTAWLEVTPTPAFVYPAP